MAEPKTKPTESSALDFIKSIPDKQKREDSLVLLNVFESVTKQKAKMWGTSIIGFGMYRYESSKSSQKGDWPLVAFSPRKQNLTLYIIDGNSDSVEYSDLLGKLGKHKVSKACLYINKLSDVSMTVLKQLVKKSFLAAKKKHSV